MNSKFTSEGPALRRRKRSVKGMGSFRFLIIVLAIGVLAAAAATSLRDPMNDLIQSWIGLDLHKASMDQTPQQPAPIQLR